ncbi:MAG: putative tRNA threonylcarbamoyladenosine biosynthesis protein Gcp [candidate division WWE3 bacterium GW2011_GWC1_47_10]|uniref:N(6)-L-threonylcarbamoyladenine synthase n=1 Tax=candidate division WWE3 bacterium GW2011_GWC1_47_10 TaxID=1619122 RepID=A0A0G1TWG4_UNCKA|nr:MAG: putative tRNA threonylcarbamoyladenosine biosynthesis protein Gcp [candidate division WWE3 bacterium GW2011_GWC1_47_10]
MLILGIETSCDETAAALVEDGIYEISSVVASSQELHKKTGGVVPEVAARKQVEFMVPAIAETLKKARVSAADIDALAVTVGPGLIGSLFVGVEAAKALAMAWDKPLIPVNHLVGHIYAAFIGSDAPALPAVVLIVSGGHTDLVLMRGPLSRKAQEVFPANSSRCPRLPRPMLDQATFDFSFSGLKTAVKRLVEKGRYPVAVVAREFEDAVVDVLVAKTMRAAKGLGVKSVIVGGGVAANSHLRNRLRAEVGTQGFTLHIPPPRLCTDNAVVIASAAYFNQTQKKLSEIQPNPSLVIAD